MRFVGAGIPDEPAQKSYLAKKKLYVYLTWHMREERNPKAKSKIETSMKKQI